MVPRNAYRNNRPATWPKYWDANDEKEFQAWQAAQGFNVDKKSMRSVFKRLRTFEVRLTKIESLPKVAQWLSS